MPHPPSTVQFCSANGLTLSYRLFSQDSTSNTSGKTPVLFVHGLSYFSYDWVDFGQQLCQDRAGCAMDMRGFGDSSNSPGGDYSVPTMSADILALLDHLGWEKVILVAHSMGGRSASHFTTTHPERVEALVLVDWSPENAATGSKRVAHTVANTPAVFESIDAIMQYFGTDPDSPDAQGKRARYQAYSRTVTGGLSIKRDPYFSEQFRHQLATGEKPKHGVDLWQVVAALSVPTLVLRGTRSDLFADTTIPKLLASNPALEVQEIEAGHHIAGDNPQAALAAIRHFIH